MFDEHPLYAWTVVTLVVAGLASFALLLFVPAPYGRHTREGWGPRIDARIAWLVMEAPSPLCFVLVLFLYGPEKQTPQWVLLGMYIAHYGYRAFVYPFRMRAGQRQMPIVTAALAVLFNVANGSTNAFAIAALSPHLDPSWLADPRFGLGLLLFITGYTINHQSDAILRRLRAPGETDYKVPHGGLYRWVSSPNYLGEIIEWLGFAVAAWTIPAWVFVFFTCANLLPRALTHHRWYLERFADYPKKRRALIPFIL